MDDKEIVSVQVGAVAGTVVRPLFRVPDGFGGITLTNVWLACGAAATSVLQLVNLGTALGTAVSSVVGTLNGTMVANVQQAIAITTAYQAEGTWLGLKTLAGGGLDTVSNVTVEFAYGK